MDPVTIAALIAGAASVASGGLSFVGAENANNARVAASNVSNMIGAQNALYERQFAAEQGNWTKQWNAGQAALQRDWQDMEAGKAYDRTAEQANISRVFSAEQADAARAFDERMVLQNQGYNRESVAQAQEFSTRMSNSAYQRGMADMKAAGLNPLLAYQQGGASSPLGATMPAGILASPSPSSSGGTIGAPSGAAATSSGVSGGHFTPGSKADVVDSLTGAVNSALRGSEVGNILQKGVAEVQNLGAQTRLAGSTATREEASSKLIGIQALTEAERAGLVKSEAAKNFAEALLTQTKFEAGLPQTESARNVAESAAARARASLDIFSTQEGAGKISGEIAGAVSTIQRLLGALKGLGNPSAPLPNVPGGMDHY